MQGDTRSALVGRYHRDPITTPLTAAGRFRRQWITSSSRPLQIRSLRFKISAYCPLSPHVVPTNAGTSHAIIVDSGGNNTGQLIGTLTADLFAQDVSVSIRHRLNRAIITRRSRLEPLEFFVTGIA